MKIKPLIKLLIYLIIGLFIWVSCSSGSNSDKNEENKNKQNQSTSSTGNKTPQQQAAEEKVSAEQNKKNVLEEIEQYKTGLTFEQMAREPKAYFATKGIFTGKVVQVVKGDLFHTMRLAIDGDYKKMVKVDYANEASSKNVLEGDNITVYGIFEGESSYTSTSGAKITLPQIHGLLIDIK